MDCRRIRKHQLIQLAEAVCDIAAVEVGVELAFLHIDMRHNAQIAVVDVLGVVVLDLHDLVARTERPAKALNPGVAWRVQHVLKLDIQGARTEAAAVHRAEHLDVAYRVEPEALRNALLDDRQHLPDALFCVGSVDKVEVAGFGGGEIGHPALIDAMRVDPRGASSLRRKTPVLGSVSSNRWMVFALRPVLSDSRFAARTSRGTKPNRYGFGE